MRVFFVRRLLQSVLLILAITFINFVILRVTPGDPLSIAKYNDGKPLTARDAEKIAALQKQLKIYTDPFPLAFVDWTVNAITFSFGDSVQTRLPVTPRVLRAATNSFWLLVGGVLLGLVGIPLGVWAALRRDSRIDSVLRFITLIFTTLPGWFIALFVHYILGQYLITHQDNQIPFLAGFFAFLPTFLIAVIFMARFFTYARAQTLEVLQEDYVRTAHAKGLPSSIVLYRHVFRNSLAPIIGIFGGLIPFIFSAQILIERSSGVDGLGGLFLSSAASRDYTTLMAIFTFLTTICVLCSFLADMAYGLFDPRVRTYAK